MVGWIKTIICFLVLFQFYFSFISRMPAALELCPALTIPTNVLWSLNYESKPFSLGGALGYQSRSLYDNPQTHISHRGKYFLPISNFDSLACRSYCLHLLHPNLFIEKFSDSARVRLLYWLQVGFLAHSNLALKCIASRRVRMSAQVKILRRKLDDMERSYDVLLDEVKQMRLRVEGKDAHGSQSAPGDADKTHEEKIQARHYDSLWESYR